MVNAMLVHNGWAKATDQAVSDAAQELASAKRDRVFEICDVKMGSSHEVGLAGKLWNMSEQQFTTLLFLSVTYVN